MGEVNTRKSCKEMHALVSLCMWGVHPYVLQWSPEALVGQSATGDSFFIQVELQCIEMCTNANNCQGTVCESCDTLVWRPRAMYLLNNDTLYHVYFIVVQRCSPCNVSARCWNCSFGRRSLFCIITGGVSCQSKHHARWCWCAWGVMIGALQTSPCSLHA